VSSAGPALDTQPLGATQRVYSLTSGCLSQALFIIYSDLWPCAECGGASLDHHRSFVVRYHPEEDVQLEYHYDDAEVTLNVNLGVEFEGGQVLFGAMRDAPSHAHHQRHAIDHVVVRRRAC